MLVVVRIQCGVVGSPEHSLVTISLGQAAQVHACLVWQVGKAADASSGTATAGGASYLRHPSI